MPTYGKQFSEVYDEVSKDCGDTTSSFITEIKKKINDVGRSIFNTMNYHWKQKTADLTLVASTQSYAMSDIASDWDEMTPLEIYYRGSANQRTILDPYDNNEWAEEQDDDEGDCYGYHVEKISGAWKVSFVFVPSSGFVSAYSPLKMEYFKKWTELSNDTDIPDIPTSHHQLLVYRANVLVCGIMGDLDLAAFWSAAAKKEQGALNKKQVHYLGRAKRAYPRKHLTRERSARRRDYNL